MTRSRRIGLMVLLLLGLVVTEVANVGLRRWLTEQWGGAALAGVVIWTFFNLVWMLPLLHPKVRRDVRFRSSRRTWTVLLLLPYPLSNVGIGQGLPVLRHSAEMRLLAWLVTCIALFAEVFWEELLFRGYALYQASSNPRFAIVVSVIVFAGPHLLGGHSPIALIPIFFLGITTALVRIVSGGLAWPIVSHVALNLLARVLRAYLGRPLARQVMMPNAR